MKIKFKITLLFTLLVTIILLVLGVSIYYFSSLNRKSEFSQRLRNRALTTTRLLLNAEGIDKPLLRKIDSLTTNLLFEESILIFNYKNELLYSNHNELADSSRYNSSFLDKIRVNKTYNFRLNDADGVGVLFADELNRYVIIATAIDKRGQQELIQLRKVLITSGVVGIAITLLAGYFFSMNLLRPLMRINKEMTEISLQNISKRVESQNKNDELSELSKNFNNLLDRLEISFNNQKRFIANASHELATPLAAISSQLEVTLMQKRSENEYKAVLTSVQEDVVQLNKLVRQLLDLANAGAGKGISLEPVRIDEILLKAMEEINSAYKDYQVSFSFNEIPEEESLCYIYGNEELLFIAFKNMMENACKYSSLHRAWVSLAIEPAQKIVRIKDEGIGMQKEELEKVFEPFYRSHDAEQITQGLGLGLSMSNRIIRLHKGEITVISEPGKGSVFTITLPAM